MPNIPPCSISSDPHQPYFLPALVNTPQIAYAWRPMLRDTTDEDLMLRYRDHGDTTAFEILYSRYKKLLFRYLQHQCGNAAVAEELFQDVWMNMIKSRERYEVKASFKTFVYRMAHNRLIDHYRKHRHGVPSSYDENEEMLNSWDFADPITPEQVASGHQQIERLLQAIEALPEAQREAFLLKEATGLGLEEIAQVTNVNSETAKSRLRYAINKLRQALE